MNDDKQMRSDWELPLCTGAERLKLDGHKAHPTQKPEALLYRVLLATSAPGAGCWTRSWAQAPRRSWPEAAPPLDRRRADPIYAQLARERIAATPDPMFSDDIYHLPSRRTARRVPFGTLIEAGLIQPGHACGWTAARNWPPRSWPTARS